MAKAKVTHLIHI